ncbi:MAG: type II toxin-antitoxin system Phd/YefM family antitoxin [Calditrichaceae bacterium]|nr:type II toxin-antitoxin system Phd/YefM family antitoxin [Calditrichia bacterium]NUQ41048.1 type II toxin-antitoxin system Phd/YefM family antitoxin [Calditrichaceae bacterium]
MRRIQIDEDIKPLSEFRANATALIRRISQTKRPLIITQKGKSAAVILDVAQYEALLDKLELLQDLAAAEKQISEGRIYDHEEAKKKVIESVKQ